MKKMSVGGVEVVQVIASGFSDLGFDCDIGPLFSTPEEVKVLIRMKPDT